MKNRITLIVLATTISIFASCKKKDTGSGTFYFHIQSNIEGNKIKAATFLPDSLSQYSFSITKASCFISGIILTNTSGGTYTIPDAHILITTDGEEYLAGTAPVGKYSGVSFNIGLDPATNKKTPSEFIPTGYASAATMWYGNTDMGYNFMKLQGYYDTSVWGTSVIKQPFSFEIGVAANGVQKVTLPERGGALIPSFKPYTLTAGSKQYIKLYCDYGQILYRVRYVEHKPNGDTTDTYTVRPDLATFLSKTASPFRYAE